VDKKAMPPVPPKKEHFSVDKKGNLVTSAAKEPAKSENDDPLNSNKKAKPSVPYKKKLLSRAWLDDKGNLVISTRRIPKNSVEKVGLESIPSFNRPPTPQPTVNLTWTAEEIGMACASSLMLRTRQVQEVFDPRIEDETDMELDENTRAVQETSVFIESLHRAITESGQRYLTELEGKIADVVTEWINSLEKGDMSG
jgi:hypothetical protein